MAQNFTPLDVDDSATALFVAVEDNFTAIRSTFSGTALPTEMVAGQLAHLSGSHRIVLARTSGTSPVTETVNGYLAANATATGNVTSGLDDLQSVSVPASTLLVPGQALRIKAHFRTAANANTKTFGLKVGSTNLLLVSAVAINGGSAIIEADVFVTGTNVQVCYAKVIASDATLVPSVTVRTALTLDTALAHTITTFGQSGASTSDDVISEVLTVEVVR